MPKVKKKAQRLGATVQIYTETRKCVVHVHADIHHVHATWYLVGSAIPANSTSVFFITTLVITRNKMAYGRFPPRDGHAHFPQR